MGTDTDTKSSSPSELKPLEEFGPDQEPFKEPDENDGEIKGQLDPDDPTDPNSDETAVSLDTGPDDPDGEDGDVSDDTTTDDEPSVDAKSPEKEDPSAEDPQKDPDREDGDVSDDTTTDDEPNVDDKSPEKEENSAGGPQKDPAGNNNDNDFVALDNDEVDDGIGDKPQKEEKAADGDDKQQDVREDQAEKNAAKDKDPSEIKKIDKKEKAPPNSTVNSQTGKKSVKGVASSIKIIGSALILFMIAGLIIYSRPALLGLKGKAEDVLPAKTAIKQPAKPEKIQVRKSKPPGKHDLFLTKLEEVDRLREELLAKKEEIYRLKLHYRNGIVELKDQIGRQMQESDISSYLQALKNKRIELNLRTIQRRQVYIQELEKPDQWVHNGSEELLFLKRKALLDLQMADIASGIDLDRHMRYMNAAIQKYQPSAENLAVDPPPVEYTPLETIWSQILNRQTKNVQTSIGPDDEKIIAEVCSGNFRRIAELSAITAQAARCLSRMNGSDLFLNGLTQITAEEAKYLFQWPGNWICLNSVKKFSPAVARYLFKWEGSWISLNGLTEFPPELAVLLMEWKGNQLELMGLNYDKSKPDQRALKYLALWETMGGKLFVSDGIRKEMEQVM
jgi:hypothetical protein